MDKGSHEPLRSPMAEAHRILDLTESTQLWQNMVDLGGVTGVPFHVIKMWRELQRDARENAYFKLQHAIDELANAGDELADIPCGFGEINMWRYSNALRKVISLRDPTNISSPLPQEWWEKFEKIDTGTGDMIFPDGLRVPNLRKPQPDGEETT